MSSHNSNTANNSSSSSNKAASAAPPLNVYMKVAVIRRPSDSLQYEDNEGNPKTVSIQELGDAIATAVRCVVLKVVFEYATTILLTGLI